MRDIWETIIVTGRRVSEVLQLRLDCTGRYGGLAMLWHDQTKVGSYDQAIRIPEWLSERLAARRETTVARFTARHGHGPAAGQRAAMALFPGRYRNPDGTAAVTYQWFHSGFKAWVDDLDIGRWVAHQARHTLATSLQVSRVASAASFGSSREHALPAAQRAALQRARRAGAPGGCGDQGFHGPPGSDATMMRLRPLRGVHHRCVFWHHDAFGSSRLHRVHHRRCRSAAPGRHRSREGRAEPSRHWSRHPPDLAPAALVAPGASRVPGPEVPAAASSPVSSAARRRAADAAGAHRTPRPVKAPDLALVHGWGIHTRNHRPGSSLQAPGSG